jgi:hypothetical protein
VNLFAAHRRMMNPRDRERTIRPDAMKLSSSGMPWTDEFRTAGR